MISLLPSVLLLLLSQYATAASDKPLKSCTVVSPTSDRFFDLNPLQRLPPPGDKKKKKEGDEGSWHAKGYDYGANFTVNFCGPVVEELDAVQDLDKPLWRNVSAFYEKGGKQWAIGLENSVPIFRGRKLILNYTGGSLCPSSSKSKRSPIALPHDVREIITDPDKDHDDDKKKPKKPSKDKEDKNSRRKTTVISLLCDSDPLAKTSISFVAAVDDCSYFFEGRSPFACGGVHQETQALGPGGVFGVIALIAVLVYFVGGYVYQRTVMHQRGWRQLPNYAMWAGIWRFFSDMFVILTSSCARFMPSRRGYSRVSLGQENGRRGRRNEDENRLIDNLDEEWDD
ncbi:mannose 6-phosphate receptor domain-containing protein [Cucurbitaria berberidis CBS 394.84]|uniref:Mannose 6-phosphate receptor domain-containing protein n=1 Tax=Cucurbitaria berberidis CBS 394.84 TaxID=1168544 RepID=A0A9P4GGB8_9PLEO|nr:mannose 6-phosphate receptor domain-containing protein [Cucurbitaria berberidis CBS 394.84]KAF1844660.1 mannose 6-phosphate receptor domain-containing protein [Cucurbitaria berberidis CBS 394.84]